MRHSLGIVLVNVHKGSSSIGSCLIVGDGTGEAIEAQLRDRLKDIRRGDDRPVTPRPILELPAIVDHLVQRRCKHIHRIDDIVDLRVNRQVRHILIASTPAVEDTIVDAWRAEGHGVTGVDDAAEFALPDLVEGGVVCVCWAHG